jgi:hypothetical protein
LLFSSLANAAGNATSGSIKFANGTILYANGTIGNATNVTVRAEASYPEDLLTYD